MQVLELAEAKIDKAQHDLTGGLHARLMQDITELKQLMKLMKDLLKDEESLSGKKSSLGYTPPICFSGNFAPWEHRPLASSCQFKLALVEKFR